MFNFILDSFKHLPGMLSKSSVFGNCLGEKKNPILVLKVTLISEIKYFWANCFPPTILSMTHDSPEQVPSIP